MTAKCLIGEGNVPFENQTATFYQDSDSGDPVPMTPFYQYICLQSRAIGRELRENNNGGDYGCVAFSNNNNHGDGYPFVWSYDSGSSTYKWQQRTSTPSQTPHDRTGSSDVQLCSVSVEVTPISCLPVD